MASIVATYKLPCPLKVSAQCFGTSTDAVLAGRQVTLTTPPVHRSDADGDLRFVVSPPLIPDLPSHPDEDHPGFWGNVSEWKVSPPEYSSGWLSAVTFMFEASEQSLAAPSEGARWRPAGAAIDELFQLVPLWFELLLVWIGVTSDQDTFIDTPHVLPSVQGEGLAVRAVTPAGPSESVWPTKGYLWRKEVSAISRATLEDVIGATGRGQVPPPAHLLIRDARADMVRGNCRKAVIDAGAAVELALSDWRRAHPPLERDPLPTRPTLGVRVIQATRPLPPETMNDLVYVRNDAIHNGLIPSRAQTEKAIGIASRIVGDLQPLFPSTP